MPLINHIMISTQIYSFFPLPNFSITTLLTPWIKSIVSSKISCHSLVSKYRLTIIFHFQLL